MVESLAPTPCFYIQPSNPTSLPHTQKNLEAVFRPVFIRSMFKGKYICSRISCSLQYLSFLLENIIQRLHGMLTDIVKEFKELALLVEWEKAVLDRFAKRFGRNSYIILLYWFKKRRCYAENFRGP